ATAGPADPSQDDGSQVRPVAGPEDPRREPGRGGYLEEERNPIGRGRSQGERRDHSTCRGGLSEIGWQPLSRSLAATGEVADRRGPQIVLGVKRGWQSFPPGRSQAGLFF